MSTKTVTKWFDITMHEEEQAWLRDMHNQGWKLTNANWAVYTFESCEPEDVVYQLDYHKELNDKEEYLQMFRDCGWEFITENMGYTYFSKAAADMDGQEGIFCDYESRMGMWDRVFKHRIVMMLILFCGVIVPQMLMLSGRSGWEYRIFFGVYVAIFVVYVVLFIRFAKRYKEAKDKE